jgi:hypothetical protein
MEKSIIKAALINNAVAADFLGPDVNGFCTIKYLPKFNTAWLKLIAPGITNVYRVDTLPIAEVVKVTNVAPVTVVSDTKYQLMEMQEMAFYQTWSKQPLKFGYTSPAVLGTQANENHNMFSALAYKINNTPGSLATAYPLVTLTHAAANFVIGEILTGAISGATGIVVYEDAAGLNSIVALIGTTLFTVGENVDDQTGTGPAAVGVVTVGEGLRIVDNSGYYNAKGTRGGINTFVATSGFASTDVFVELRIMEVITAATTLWNIGDVITGDVTFAAGILIRKVSNVRSLVALTGSLAFDAAQDNNLIATGATLALTSSAAAAAGSPGTLPFYAYSQGQGARILQDVPQLSLGSSNLNSGSFSGPQGDTPAVGTEYMQIDWAYNLPISPDGISQAVIALPAPVRLWVSVADYSAVDGFLNTQGVTA